MLVTVVKCFFHDFQEMPIELRTSSCRGAVVSASVRLTVKEMMKAWWMVKVMLCHGSVVISVIPRSGRQEFGARSECSLSSRLLGDVPSSISTSCRITWQHELNQAKVIQRLIDMVRYHLILDGKLWVQLPVTAVSSSFISFILTFSTDQTGKRLRQVS